MLKIACMLESRLTDIRVKVNVRMMRCGRNEKNSNTRLTIRCSGRLCSVSVLVLTLEHFYISDFRGACVSIENMNVVCYVVLCCCFSLCYSHALPLSLVGTVQCLSLFRWVSLLLGCAMAYILSMVPFPSLYRMYSRSVRALFHSQFLFARTKYTFFGKG